MALTHFYLCLIAPVFKEKIPQFVNDRRANLLILHIGS